jgi:hypothetical protein
MLGSRAWPAADCSGSRGRLVGESSEANPAAGRTQASGGGEVLPKLPRLERRRSRRRCIVAAAACRSGWAPRCVTYGAVSTLPLLQLALSSFTADPTAAGGLFCRTPKHASSDEFRACMQTICVKLAGVLKMLIMLVRQ